MRTVSAIGFAFLAATAAAAAKSEPPIVVIERIETPPPIKEPVTLGARHICKTYPREAAGAEGKTLIGYTVSEKGLPVNIHVIQSSGNAALDRASVECASRWRYKPAIQRHRPIAVPWKAEITWTADKSPPSK